MFGLCVCVGVWAVCLLAVCVGLMCVFGCECVCVCVFSLAVPQEMT